MGLFERKTTPISIPLYSVSSETTKLVAGLGNVGKQYDYTRHNAGFLCIDHLVMEQGGTWKEKKSLKCLMGEIRLGDRRVICIKPTTLMNLSGDAIQGVKKFYKIANKDILVVHDELDMPFGSLRLRIGGGSAGHNGIKSVSGAIGEDYARLRIGIANDISKKTPDAAEFVLKAFSKKEQDEFPKLYKETTALINEFAYSDQLLPDTRSFL